MLVQENCFVSRQDLANVVAAFDNLTNLHLSDSSVEMINDAFLARLASSRPTLKALHVCRGITLTECGGNKDEHPVTEAGLEILFLKCTQLEEITLHCLHKDTEIPDSFFQLQQLHTVSLTNVSALTFPRFTRLSSLTSLHINVSKLTHQELSSLFCIARLSRLSISSEFCIPKNDPPAAIFAVAQLPHLESFEFQIPNLSFTSMFPTGSPCIRLEQLVISKSANLQRLPDDIGELLPCLHQLTIRDCSQLDQLPDNITALTALERLSITGCLLRRLPEEFGQLPALKSLMLEDLPLRKLPDSLCRGTSLEKLLLRDLYLMHHLPTDFCSLTSLKTLDARNSLMVLPKRIGWLSNLETLHLHTTEQLLFPSFVQLIVLKSLELGECEFTVLPKGLDNLSNLQHLYIHDCDAVRKIPLSIKGLTSLVTLVIEDCQQLTVLPRRLKSLTKLKSLRVTRCRQLCGFPLSLPLSLEILSWYRNSRADSLPQISLPPFLRQLELGLAENAHEFPIFVESASQLHLLSIYDAELIQTLPRSIGSALQQLRHLRLHNLEELRELPETFSQLQHLTALEVVAPKVTSLPDVISALSRLRELDLSGCKALQQLPFSLTQLRCLCTLKVEKTSISSLPPGFAQLTRLRWLSLFGCERLRALPDNLTELKVLQHLNVKGCKQAIDGMTRALRCGLRDMHGLTFIKY